MTSYLCTFVLLVLQKDSMERILIFNPENLGQIGVSFWNTN